MTPTPAAPPGYQLHYGGEWRAPHGAEVIVVHSPARQPVVERRHGANDHVAAAIGDRPHLYAIQLDMYLFIVAINIAFT